MIRQGKVYQNVMIDVQPTNSKLVDRACRIINITTGASKEKALEALKETNNDVSLTIVMLKTGKNREDSQKLLAQEHGNVSQVLKER